jgi:hypothetical protein
MYPTGGCPDVPSPDEPMLLECTKAEPRPALSRRIGQDWMKASRSALIVGLWVVGMPWGNPW